MRDTIWEKKIPTLLGIFLIVIGLGITSYLATQGIIFVSKASPTNKPTDIRITNTTDSSFTVSFRTADKVIGSINYGKDKKLGSVGRDDRDQQTNSLNPYNIHNMTIRGLDPSAKYLFTITSGNDTFQDTSYEVSTSSKIENSPSQQEPISGKIVLPDSSSPKEAIVYATIEGAQTISTLAKPDGSYILPLNSLRNKDLNSYFNFNNDKIKIQVIGDQGLASNIVSLLTQINPVPTVTLSKNYDFTQGVEPVSSDSANLQQFPSFAGIKPASKSPSVETKIISPEDNQSFSDPQPEFKGTAAPDSTVEITIHSLEQIQQTVTTDQYGNWSFRPTQPLSSGEHTITITTKDANGISITSSKTFLVFESGTQVADSATSSATPTETPIPTETPPLLSPTPIIIPSPTLSPVPTIPVNPTAPLISTPTPTLTSPGSSSAVGIGGLGLAISLFGGFLFLLTHKKSIL